MSQASKGRSIVPPKRPPGSEVRFLQHVEHVFGIAQPIGEDAFQMPGIPLEELGVRRVHAAERLPHQLRIGRSRPRRDVEVPIHGHRSHRKNRLSESGRALGLRAQPVT